MILMVTVFLLFNYIGMNRKTYPSDISREQFAPLLPLLESARKRIAPRQVDLYDVFCAILYL